MARSWREARRYAYDPPHKGFSTASLADLNTAALVDPSDAGTFYWRGVVYAKSNKPDLARQNIEEAIRLDPRDFASYRYLDQLLAPQKEWDTIIQYWTQFLKLKPTHAEAYLERSGTYYWKRDFTAAQTDAQRACLLGSEKGCQFYERLKGMSVARSDDK